MGIFAGTDHGDPAGTAPQSTPASAPASTTPTSQQPQQPKPQAGQDWEKALGGNVAMQHDDSTDQTQIQPHAVTTLPTPPSDAERVPRKGLGGVIDKFVDAIAGTDTSRVRQDPQGNLYIQHSTPTRGEQWMRIAATAIAGAGAGLAAGRPAKALAAGVAEGAKIQQMQTQADKEKQLQVATSQALTHQTAVQAFQLQQMQRKGTQDDITFSQAQEDRLKSQGAQVVGHADSPAAMFKFMRETPNFNEDQVKNNAYRVVATYDEKGNSTGVDIYRTVPGHENEMMPAGTEIHVWDPVAHKMTTQKTTAPRLTSEINALNAAAGNASDKWQLDQATINEKNAAAQAKTNPPEKQEAPSMTRLHNAEADLAEARRKQIQTGAALPDGTPNPRFEEMAKAIEAGDILPQDLKREAKGANLDPNELLGRAAEIAQQNGRHFSLPIIEQEHKFAANPKTQAALDGIDRVLGTPGSPGYMDQMLQLAKKADLGTNGAMNSASLAVHRFFGSAAAKNFETSVAETRRSIAGLIGNPLLGGSETDKKLQQAEEMLGKSPTMENLEGAAKVLRQALQTQRNSIVGNNRYLRQRYGTAGAAPGSQQQQPPAQLTQMHRNPQTGQTIGLNAQNQWVDATTGQEVK